MELQNGTAKEDRLVLWRVLGPNLNETNAVWVGNALEGL